jgi:carboxyl-terminal processing protease
MWLAGTKALFQIVPDARPAGLSARISQITSPDEFREFLKAVWFEELTPQQRRTALAAAGATDVFLDGLERVVADMHVLVASEAIAQEQIAANRYVGTGIALSFNESERYAGIANVIRGGPMERAGGRNGDLITKIDGRDVRNVAVMDIVELLRGAEGTTVNLELRGSAGKDLPRTVTVTRGPVIFEALAGLHRDRDGNWDYRIEPHLPMRYVKFLQVNGSAAHELKRLERQFRADGVAAVILDFRSTESSDAHQALLLADALMDGGLIGRLRTSNGHVQEFHGDRECVFRDWPLAVLIDGETRGGPEWIAAALQDNRACVVVGQTSAGSAWSSSIVHVPAEKLSVQLPTGMFERPSRKPLQRETVPIGHRRVARRNEPLPGGMTPDRDVSFEGVAIVPGKAANDQPQLDSARQQRDPDIVITAAIQELRDRID